MQSPLVSVVMATYNGAKYLKEQLQSICTQTYTNLEIIVCDDDSKDETQNTIKEFAEKDGRIKYYFNKSNVGVNKNFEKAILQSTGTFIAISDQDDIWHEQKIEEQLKLFTNEKVILTHSASKLFTNKNSSFVRDERFDSKMMIGCDSRRLLLRNSISGHNIIFRKSLISHIIPVPNSVYYDWWIAEVSTTVGCIAATNKIMTLHRKHESNLTEKNKKAARQTIAESTERIEALESFITILTMPPTTKRLAESLLCEYKKLKEKKFSIRLFILLMRNSSTLFFYKKKRFPFFSYIKTAFRMSHSV